MKLLLQGTQYAMYYSNAGWNSYRAILSIVPFHIDQEYFLPRSWGGFADTFGSGWFMQYMYLCCLPKKYVRISSPNCLWSKNDATYAFSLLHKRKSLLFCGLCRWAMQSMYFFVCSVPVLDLTIAHNTYSSVVFMFTFIFLQTLQPVLQLAFQWFNKQCCGWISFVIQIIPVHTGFCKCMVATGHTHTSKYAHVCEESHFVPRYAQGWQW